MGITWSPAATDDFLSILKKVDELFGKMIAIKVSNKIQLHIGLLSSFPQIGYVMPFFRQQTEMSAI